MALCRVEVGSELRRCFCADGLAAAKSLILVKERAVLEEYCLKLDAAVSRAAGSMMILRLVELVEFEQALLVGHLLGLRECHEGCCQLRGRPWGLPWW